MTHEEYMSAMQWVTDQYRMALEFNEAYMPALRGIPERIRSGELTPAEGKSLFALYEKAKEEMDRHIAEVRKIEAAYEQKFSTSHSSTVSSRAADSTASTTATTSNPR